MVLPSPPRDLRPVPADRDPARLEEDLLDLARVALEAGADRSGAVALDALARDPALARPGEAEAAYRSVTWPLELPRDSLDEAIAAYRHGLLLSVLGGREWGPDPGMGPIADAELRATYLRLQKAVTAVESAAFYRGHHLALGLGAGHCRALFCFDEDGCRATTRNGTCRHPWRSRVALRAAGVDGAATARALGWEVDPEGPSLYGLVLVA